MAVSASRSKGAPECVLVAWLSCLLVGALGFAVPYPRPQPRPEPERVVAQHLDLDLSPGDESAPAFATSNPNPASSTERLPALPPEPPSLVLPSVPATLALATPDPAAAFPIPSPAAVATVADTPAADARTESPEQAMGASPLPVEALVHGRGEGRQPAPEYPPQAAREGQEGVVGVRFVVGPDGRVTFAEAHQPSAWRLLNDVAVRTVRHRWRFQPGQPRAFEVAIHFQLQR
ncbi:MAG: TonB family protein [Verrucomicrobiae bacterium]|nr:TonB family protein [Verrucomicrobiae bacterium]